MRCKLCCRFYNRNFQLCKNDKQLAAIYDANFKEQLTSRRAFIIRSHKLRDGNVSSWIKRKLHAMSSERNSLKRKRPSGFSDYLGPASQHNATGAGMSPVPAFTQEQTPIVILRGIARLSRLAPQRCITSTPRTVPPGRGLTRSAIWYIRKAMYNPPPHTAHTAWWHSGREPQPRSPERARAIPFPDP